jgi:sodium transport system permease protein
MKNIAHIYKKETREMLRDKRVRSGAFFTPAIMIILILMLMGTLVSTLSKKSNVKFHAVNVEHPLAQALKKGEFTITPVESESAGEELIKSGKANLVLVFPEKDTPGEPIVVRALLDKNEERANVSLSILTKAFQVSGKEALKKVLEQAGIPGKMAEPIQLQEVPLQVGTEKNANAFLISILPYVIVIWAFYGVMGVVSDMVAGEKEKQTLETLLISPVARTEIVLGKFFALAQISLASSASALAGVVILYLSKNSVTAEIFKDGLGLSVTSTLVVLLTLIPAAAMFSAVMLAISTYAKNMRESQTYLTVASMLVLIPAMMTQVIGYLDVTNNLAIYAVPVLNSAAIIRAALLGKLSAAPVAVCIVVNLILAAIGLMIAIRLFKREQVLVRV